MTIQELIEYQPELTNKAAKVRLLSLLSALFDKVERNDPGYAADLISKGGLDTLAELETEDFFGTCGLEF